VTDLALDNIDELDLNSYEVKIWKALLKNGISTAGQLSEQTEVPRSRSYDVLESLEKKGFVVMQVGKPIKYIAIPPQEVFRRIKNNIASEAEERVNALDELDDSEMLGELQTLYESDVDPKDTGEIINHKTGARKTKKRLADTIQSAEETICITTRDPSIYQDTSILNALNVALQRGVDIKILSTKEFNAELSEEVEIKTHSLDAEFVVVDNHTSFVYITQPNGRSAKALGLNAPFFTTALLDLFHEAWRAA
jgi:sugar-specific transcriptional regulator TrmB